MRAQAEGRASSSGCSSGPLFDSVVRLYGIGKFVARIAIECGICAHTLRAPR